MRNKHAYILSDAVVFLSSVKPSHLSRKLVAFFEHLKYHSPCEAGRTFGTSVKLRYVLALTVSKHIDTLKPYRLRLKELTLGIISI